MPSPACPAQPARPSLPSTACRVQPARPPGVELWPLGSELHVGPLDRASRGGVDIPFRTRIRHGRQDSLCGPWVRTGASATRPCASGGGASSSENESGGTAHGWKQLQKSVRMRAYACVNARANVRICVCVCQREFTVLLISIPSRAKKTLISQNANIQK